MANIYLLPTERTSDGSYILRQPEGTFIFKTLKAYLSFQKLTHQPPT